MDVLLIEDDDAIAEGLRRVLTEQGFAVRRLAHGGGAVEAAKEPSVGVVLLDLGLPDMDGITVCQRLRAARSDLAILILTARDQEADVVAGLDAGADDYLTKPFRLAELLARLRAHARRIEAAVPEPEGKIEVGDVMVDLESHRVFVKGKELDLRPKEFELLEALIGAAGRALTRERLMKEVWNTDWLGDTKTLDIHISSLRRKLPKGAVTTLRGVGYRYEAA